MAKVELLTYDRDAGTIAVDNADTSFASGKDPRKSVSERVMLSGGAAKNGILAPGAVWQHRRKRTWHYRLAPRDPQLLGRFDIC